MSLGPTHIAQDRIMTGPFVALTEYELRHLPGHLVAAGRGNDLHRLLTMESEPGDRGAGLGGRSSNAWYTALEHVGYQSQYLRHLDVALRHAGEDTATALGTPTAGDLLLREIEYAISTASVRNVSANIPARLLVQLLRRGRISYAEAVTYIRQVPDPRQRAEGLTGLLELTKDEGTAEDLAGEALAAVSDVDDEYWRVAELGQLVAHLPNSLFPGARLIAGRFDDPYYQAVAQAVIGGDLNDDLRARLASLQFGQAGVTTAEYDLTGPEPRFREDYMTEYLERVEHATRNLAESLSRNGPESVTSPTWRAVGYAALAAKAERYLEPALTEAGTVGGRGGQVMLLRATVIRLAAAGDPATALRLLDDAACVEGDRVLIRCELAVLGVGSVDAEELSVLVDPWQRMQAHRLLLPCLDPAVRGGIVDRLLAQVHLAPEWVAVLAPHLDADAWRRAVDQVTFLDDDGRSSAYAVLVPTGVALGCREALDLLTGVADEFWQSRVVDRLVDVLIAQGRWRDAHNLADRAPFAHHQAAHLTACATAAGPWDGAELRTRGLAIAHGVPTPAGRASALLAVAHISDQDVGSLLDQATEAGRAIDGRERIRSDTLAAIAARRAEVGQVGKALELIREIGNERSRSAALTQIVEHAASVDLGPALHQIRTITARRERAKALVCLASRAAAVEPDQAPVHDYFREAVQSLVGGGREEFLHELVNLLPAVEALGGPSAVAGTVRVGALVSRWWP